MVDHDSDIPVYIQLANLLRSRIISGELQPHRPIPSIAYLQQEFGISDGTVKKAVAILREEGLVHSVSGKGTYVTGRDDG